jgi:hypothetical protein
MLKRSFLPYLLITLGFVSILAMLTWQLARNWPDIAASGTWRMPKRLAGKSLIAQKSGAVALAEIESLHGKGFDLTDGTVVRYGDATVWVARAKDDVGAQAMVDTMTRRITEGRSPFTPTGTRQVNGRMVWTLTGMGQSHFYWQMGDKVTWLAISPALAEQGLRELMLALK